MVATLTPVSRITRKLLPFCDLRCTRPRAASLMADFGTTTKSGRPMLDGAAQQFPIRGAGPSSQVRSDGGQRAA